MTLPHTDNFSNTQTYNSHAIEKAFSDFLDKPVWVASDIKDNKRPINPKTGKNASCNDPALGTFSDVQSYIEKNPDHFPAIALTSDKKLVCIDLDDVRDGDGFLPWVQEILIQTASYAERSVSGKGLHIFISGLKPGKDAGVKTNLLKCTIINIL